MEACEKKAVTKGYCGGHYNQLRRGETPRPLRYNSPKGWTMEQRLQARVEPVDDCLLWAGAKNAQGYGVLMRPEGQKGSTLTHVIAFEIHHGRSPQGQVNHVRNCPNRHCCNPEHLYDGTQWENMQDARAAETIGRWKPTHCKRGHEFDGENTYLSGGKRHCRACRAGTARKHREKAKT